MPKRFLMPLVFTYRGYRFFFFSNEGNPREPAHIHVRKGSNIAKFWVEPRVQLAEVKGFSGPELNRLAKIVHNRRNEIIEAWHAHFGT